MFLVFLLIVLLFEPPVGPEPELAIFGLMALFGLVTCSFALEDDKRIRAELDELRKLINPPETEEA